VAAAQRQRVFHDRRSAAADVLWCLATGHGLGPFLSILRTPDPWAKFERIVLVHAVRHAVELSYREAILTLGAAHPGAFTYIPMVSREAHKGALGGRIPAAIVDGSLELRAGAALSAETRTRCFAEIRRWSDDTQHALAARGMRRHRRREPGHVTVETYW
jgi:ferredoxin--NADP+ reductase